jgi:hypothetical protein
VSEEVIEEVTFLEAADTSGAMRSASLSLQGKRAQRPEKKQNTEGDASVSEWRCMEAADDLREQYKLSLLLLPEASRHIADCEGAGAPDW